MKTRNYITAALDTNWIVSTSHPLSEFVTLPVSCKLKSPPRAPKFYGALEQSRTRINIYQRPIFLFSRLISLYYTTVRAIRMKRLNSHSFQYENKKKSGTMHRNFFRFLHISHTLILFIIYNIKIRILIFSKNHLRVLDILPIMHMIVLCYFLDIRHSIFQLALRQTFVRLLVILYSSRDNCIYCIQYRFTLVLTSQRHGNLNVNDEDTCAS